MKSCRAFALYFAACSRFATLRPVAAGFLMLCIFVIAMTPAPSGGRTGDAPVHAPKKRVEKSVAPASSAKTRKSGASRRRSRPHSEVGTKTNPPPAPRTKIAKTSETGAKNATFAAAALPKIPATSPVKITTTRVNGSSAGGNAPRVAPEIIPGFSVAPLRVGQVTAKIAPAGAAQIATGSVPQSREVASDKLSVAADSRNTGCIAVASDTDAEQLSDTSIRPQVAAKAIYQPDFDIPTALRSQKLETSVTVRVRVDADGSHTASLLRGSGIAALDAAIPPYLKRWRWEPAQHNGKQVASILRIVLPIKSN